MKGKGNGNDQGGAPVPRDPRRPKPATDEEIALWEEHLDPRSFAPLNLGALFERIREDRARIVRAEARVKIAEAAAAKLREERDRWRTLAGMAGEGEHESEREDLSDEAP